MNLHSPNLSQKQITQIIQKSPKRNISTAKPLEEDSLFKQKRSIRNGALPDNLNNKSLDFSTSSNPNDMTHHHIGPQKLKFFKDRAGKNCHFTEKYQSSLPEYLSMNAELVDASKQN